MKEVQLERFVEAINDPNTGLTYPALTGIRKQSVEDVERQGVIDFMEKHNHESEATYLRMVRNWRHAVDERGLSDSQLEQFCDKFLNFIVCDLMPWYSTNQKDLSQLEINRSAKI